MTLIFVAFWWMVRWLWFVAVLSPLVWGLWNWLMVSLFHWPAVTLLEAMGLLLLAKCFGLPGRIEITAEA